MAKVSPMLSKSFNFFTKGHSPRKDASMSLLYTIKKIKVEDSLKEQTTRNLDECLITVIYNSASRALSIWGSCQNSDSGGLSWWPSG